MLWSSLTCHSSKRTEYLVSKGWEEDSCKGEVTLSGGFAPKVRQGGFCPACPSPKQQRTTMEIISITAFYVILIFFVYLFSGWCAMYNCIMQINWPLKSKKIVHRIWLSLMKVRKVSTVAMVLYSFCRSLAKATRWRANSSVWRNRHRKPRQRRKPHEWRVTCSHGGDLIDRIV